MPTASYARDLARYERRREPGGVKSYFRALHKGCSVALRDSTRVALRRGAITMRKRLSQLFWAAFAAALCFSVVARAEDIKIGEINSYSGLPAFTEPYR